MNHIILDTVDAIAAIPRPATRQPDIPAARHSSDETQAGGAGTIAGASGDRRQTLADPSSSPAPRGAAGFERAALSQGSRL